MFLTVIPAEIQPNFGNWKAVEHDSIWKNPKELFEQYFILFALSIGLK